jgi:hypothetical protein
VLCEEWLSRTALSPLTLADKPPFQGGLLKAEAEGWSVLKGAKRRADKLAQPAC